RLRPWPRGSGPGARSTCRPARARARRAVLRVWRADAWGSGPGAARGAGGGTGRAGPKTLLTAACHGGKGAARNPVVKAKVVPLANPELGAKQICPNCQAKFYDLNRRPAHCPKCESDFDPEEAVRNRRVRGRGPAVEAEEAEDQ